MTEDELEEQTPNTELTQEPEPKNELPTPPPAAPQPNIPFHTPPGGG